MTTQPQPQTQTLTKTKTRKNPPQKSTNLKPDQIRKIARLAIKGNTERAISALTGIPKTTIHAQLQVIKDSPEFHGFADKKADCYELLQYQIVNSVDQSAIKTMISKRGLTDVGILEDKIRLIRGQSTSNISYDGRNITASLTEIMREIDRLKVGDDEAEEAETC